MDLNLAQLLGIAVALAGGAAVKKLSKSRSSIIHEWAAPAAAVAIGIGFEAVTGQQIGMETLTEGTGVGGTAVLLHSLYYGWRLNRRKKD